MKIRSITLFSKLNVPPDKEEIAQLSAFAAAARQAFTAAGYEVQTTRLATDIFPTLADPDYARNALDLVVDLEAMCRDVGFEYLSLGPAGADMQPIVPEILRRTETVFATCHIAPPKLGLIDGRSIAQATWIMREAAAIDDGFGNLRFAALANVPPGTPFFPAAYWTEERPAFGIATESADLAVDACANVSDVASAHAALVSGIEAHAKEITRVAMEVSQDEPVFGKELEFHGIDFSLAPYPESAISIGAALEALTGVPLGAAGTLAAAATLTDAIQQADFPHAGFCGLMMPVLEDNVLAKRAAEGRLHIGELLQWSAVCGTGLDTVPLPGDVSSDALKRLLFDVAALAIRLDKPLTARLMPLPGKAAGDSVHFDFPYFADGGVLPLDHGDRTGPLHKSDTLSLSRYNTEAE
jgi:hypothetical protein